MYKFRSSTKHAAIACGVGVAMMASTAAMAADKVSANVGISYNSHFVSYGSDVWGAGGSFFGSRSTTFVHGDMTIKPTENLSFNTGAWADVNDNTDSKIGGNLQEVDVWLGTSYKFNKVTAGATYQSWNYGGDVEEIVDLDLGLDDSGFYGKSGFALNPNLKWHIRTDGNGTQATGSALVLSVGPNFKVGDKMSLTIPAGVGFFLTDDFQGGTKSGYGYSYAGGSLSVPVSFIPSDYGAWALNFDLIAYFTNHDAIPNNPQENFLTGSVGLSVAF